MRRLLITGGAGFIGSHLCRRFISDGENVTCMDNLLTGRLENIGLVDHRQLTATTPSGLRSHPDNPLDLISAVLHHLVGGAVLPGCVADGAEYSRAAPQTRRANAAA